jgi:hypothetical protein
VPLVITIFSISRISGTGLSTGDDFRCNVQIFALCRIFNPKVGERNAIAKQAAETPRTRPRGLPDA